MKSKKSENTEFDVDESNDDDQDTDHVVMNEFDIATYPSDLTLSVLNEMWKNQDITIPPYQRKFVWSLKQASMLIESFLLGLPVPQVFFYLDDENKNLVIDGQQRIMTVVYFLEGYFGEEAASGRRKVFRLSGLNKKSPYYNKSFSELTESDQRKLKGRVLRAVNIRQMSPVGESTSQYHIFERLNTGGTPLKTQEIRNCVYAGPFVKLLRDLNTMESWRKIIGQKAISKTQRDVELILRVFSFYDRFESYEKPMKEFLNTTMAKHKKGNTESVKKFELLFPKACDLIIQKLGEKPFHVRGPINLATLDSVMTVYLKSISKLKENHLEAFEKLKNDASYKESTYFNTSDGTAVNDRMRLATKYLVKK